LIRLKRAQSSSRDRNVLRKEWYSGKTAIGAICLAMQGRMRGERSTPLPANVRNVLNASAAINAITQACVIACNRYGCRLILNGEKPWQVGIISM